MLLAQHSWRNISGKLTLLSLVCNLKYKSKVTVYLENYINRRKQSADGDSDSLCEKLKVGAFASRTAAGSAGEGDSAAAAESTDQLLQLFSRRSEPEDSLEKEVKDVQSVRVL